MPWVNMELRSLKNMLQYNRQSLFHWGLFENNLKEEVSGPSTLSWHSIRRTGSPDFPTFCLGTPFKGRSLWTSQPSMPFNCLDTPILLDGIRNDFMKFFKENTKQFCGAKQQINLKSR